MEKFSVKKVFEIAYAHRLLDYNGKCENLHGHNGIVEIIVETVKLDDMSMVMDFVELKNKAGRWLNDNLDHTVILSKKDPLAKILKEQNQKMFLTDENPTAEIIAKTIKDELNKMGIKAKEIRFWETQSSMAKIEEE